jgi:hypothetical protein
MSDSISISKLEVFGRRPKSVTHTGEPITFPGMTKLRIDLIPNLPIGCRIAYIYKAKSGRTMTFPSAFFKRVTGKDKEFAIVQSNKKQTPILIANIMSIWVDKSSIKKPLIAPMKDTTAQLIASMKELEKKVDRLLRRR